MSETQSAFDLAKDNDNQVNQMLADTDGSICEMQYTGAIGYHIHVADGVTDPEYLWKIALLQALDESVFQRIYCDAETSEEARRQLQRQLKDSLDPLTAEYVAEEFESNLESLIQSNQEAAQDGDGQ